MKGERMLQVTSLLLLCFNCLKKSLKVPSSETRVVVSLNDLQKESGTILHRFRKDLQQVPIVVIVNQDIQLL